MIDPKRIAGGIAVLFICLFAVYYMYRQIIGIGGDEIETETALSVSVENTVSSLGYIVRSEKIISAEAGGTIISVVGNGEKVSVGHEVANIYTNEADAETKARIDEIDSKLEILEDSTVDSEYFTIDVEKLEKERNELLSDMRKSKVKGDFADCIGKKNELLVDMNKLNNVKTGKSFDSQINELKNERTALAARSGGTYTKVYAPSSGYYYDSADGYESVFGAGIIESLTHDGFRELTEKAPDDALISSNAGKIVTDSHWYVMCELPVADTAVFETGMVYNVVFPYSYNTSLKMELYRIISETDRSTDILIFESADMPEDFGYTRSQKIQIVSESYSGLSVPKSAMRMLPDGTKGVYILSGDTVKFKKAEEIYQLENSYIVRYVTGEELKNQALEKNEKNEENEENEENDENGENDTDTEDTSEEKTYSYLALYDNIIVSGKELYDGKRIS